MPATSPPRHRSGTARYADEDKSAWRRSYGHGSENMLQIRPAPTGLVGVRFMRAVEAVAATGAMLIGLMQVM